MSSSRMCSPERDSRGGFPTAPPLKMTLGILIMVLTTISRSSVLSRYPVAAGASLMQRKPPGAHHQPACLILRGRVHQVLGHLKRLAVHVQKPEAALEVPLRRSRTHGDHHAQLEQCCPLLQALDLWDARRRATGQRHLHRARAAHHRCHLAVLKVQHRAGHTRTEHPPGAQRPITLGSLPVGAESEVHVLIQSWQAQPRASQSGTARFENLAVSEFM